MIWDGGGRLILGIPTLLVENDPLQFFRQTADFSFGPGALQTIQAIMKGLPRRVEGTRLYPGAKDEALDSL